MLRVALETNALYVSRAGVARYIRGLQRGFAETEPPDVSIFPLAWERENLGYSQPLRALRTAYRELVWARLHGPRAMRRMGVDVLHSTFEPLIRRPRGVREVVTLHDLAILRQPQRFRRWHRYASRKRLDSLRRADRIICVSRFTANEAISLLGLAPSKLTVIHNGCQFLPGDSVSEMRPDFFVPDEFFLFVGSLEPGKNLGLLKQAYATATESGRPLPPLLIVGARWQGVEGEGAPPNDWHYLGHQPDDVLVHLYRHALALVFPSIYEGFGLPVVEAMALACPVICSAVASLPEVAEGAALFTEMNPDSYLDAMRRVTGDAELRALLIEAGLERAQRFSWQRSASETLEVYRSIAVA